MITNLTLLALLLVTGTSLNAQLTYPVTKKINQVDEYFGIKVEDPYRWLENDSSVEVKNWVQEQNKVSGTYLSQIPYREKIKQKIRDLNDVPYFTAPRQVGEYYFYFHNTGLQPQDVIYRQKGLNGKPELFIDPNTLSVDGTTSVNLSDYSEDKKYITTITRKAGSDWADINVLEVATGRKMQDELKWVKNTNISWKGNGFYYSGYPSVRSEEALSVKNVNQKVYFHQLGTDQQQDQLIFEDKTNPLTFNSASCTEDKRFLFIYSFSGNNNTDIYYRDFESPDTTKKLLVKGMDNVFESVMTNNGDKLIFKTNRNASNGKIVLLDPKNPDPQEWQTLLGEKPELLQTANVSGGKLFVKYLKDVTSKVYQDTYGGRLEKEITLPDLGTANGFNGLETDSITFYGFSSFLYPYTIFKYNIKTGVSEKHYTMNMKMKAEHYETKQVFYSSKDGTKVPMFIVSKKGSKQDGSHPTLLNA